MTNTTAALHEFKIARKYLDEFITTKDTDIARLRELLDFAGQRLQKARGIDPSVTLESTHVLDGEPFTFTVDNMTAEILRSEAQLHKSVARQVDYEKTRNEYNRKAYAAYKKSLLHSNIPSVHIYLAEIALDLNDRKLAKEHLATALKEKPDDMDANKLLDRINANRTLGVAPGWKPSGGFYSALMLLFIILGGFEVYYRQTIICWVIAGICALFMKWADHSAMYDAFYRDQQRKRK